jgi:PAS domain-containing protein
MDSATGKKEALTDALEGVSEWVLIFGSDGIVEWSNRSFNDFMGCRDPADRPWNIQSLFPADANDIVDDISAVKETGEIRSGIVLPVQGKNRERKMIRFTALPHRDANQHISGIFLCGLDITDTIEMEELKTCFHSN